jgi:reverse gyrase
MGMTIWEEYKKEGMGDGRVKITLVDWIVERIKKAMHETFNTMKINVVLQVMEMTRQYFIMIILE